jgi:glutamyl-tRNA(Gln) amidotransferase subunit D
VRTRLRRLPIGTELEIQRSDGRVWRGLLVPSHAFSGPDVIQLKLASGYNVGLTLREGDDVRVVGRPKRGTPGASEAGERPAGEGPVSAGSWVALLTTGGTIASRVDYRTGGVKPVESERGFLELFPGIQADGPVRITRVFDRLSEDMVPADWQVLAERVAESFGQGAAGVVVSHGTDTLGFTAAALSFLLADLPGPVVLVGAQRSPDRPSSDSFTNLAAAIRLARSGRLGEVVVLMHEGLSDTRFAIHRGTRVRKMHSSRRDAFQTRNAPPLGRLEGDTIELADDARPPSAGPASLSSGMDDRAALLWYFPGLAPSRFRAFARGLRGLVVAGTGLGHVARLHVPWLRSAIRRGLVVAMTTQTLGGGVDPFVYSNGRELARAGVVFLDDLLPETAYVKLLWALGQADEPARVIELLHTDRAGEFVTRRRPDVNP